MNIGLKKGRKNQSLQYKLNDFYSKCKNQFEKMPVMNPEMILVSLWEIILIFLYIFLLVILPYEFAFYFGCEGIKDNSNITFTINYPGFCLLIIDLIK